MIDWTETAVRGIIAIVIALAGFVILRNVRSQGKTEQRLRDELAGEKLRAAIVESSNASAEAAAGRSDPRVRSVDGVVVRGPTLPAWLRRD